MGFCKSDFETIDKRIKTICSTDVQKIVSDVIPTTNDLEDNNTVYESNATILFIDIRKSTILTDMSKPKSMVKIYRSFMRTCVDCVRKNNGITRQFLGDRIMAIFTDQKSEDGKIISRGVDNALNCAMAMQTCIDFSVNKHFKNEINSKMIECGIGIDTGKILVTKVGMYGVESDDSKENEMDCVYVGNVTNYASKYSDIANGGEILISETTYSSLLESDKEKFTKVHNIMKGKKYTGYSTYNYYLDFSDEFENKYKPQDSLDGIDENSKALSQLVEKLDNKYVELSNKEKEISIEKLTLKEKEDNLNEKCVELKNLYFECLKNSFLKKEYILKMGCDFWHKCIDNYYVVGNKCGLSDEYLSGAAACYLIDIYNLYGLYEKAYDLMILMVKANIWVNLRKETIIWAKKNYVLFELRNALDEKIKTCLASEKNDWIKYRKEFEEYENAK